MDAAAETQRIRLDRSVAAADPAPKNERSAKAPTKDTEVPTGTSENVDANAAAASMLSSQNKYVIAAADQISDTKGTVKAPTKQGGHQLEPL